MKYSFNTLAVGLFTLLFLTSPSVYAQQCVNYLSPTLSYAPFIERPFLEKINIFSDPLEMLILRDPKLNQIVSELRNPPAITYQNESSPSNVNTKSKAPAFQSQDALVTDLKYLVLDSTEAISNLLKDYKDIKNNPVKNEVLAAQKLIENQPEYSLLFTDLGLSLWKKTELKQWLDDYSLNALSPERMGRYIYLTAQDKEGSRIVSKKMAERLAKELDEFKNFEIQNKEEMDIVNEGMETSSISFLYRSLFRQVLVEKRIELLKQIGKTTELSKLNHTDLNVAMQTLALFPEFLYQAGKVAELKMHSEHILAEGGLIFSSVKKDIVIHQRQYEVTLKAHRTVDDAKIEKLNLVLVLGPKHKYKKLNISDLETVANQVLESWDKVPQILKSSYKSKFEDLEVYLESNVETPSGEIVISPTPLFKQHAQESYLMFGLFNQL